MQNDNIIPASSEVAIAYVIEPGVTVFVTKDALPDFLAHRAAHLAAVNALMMSSDFEGWDESTKADIKWLASTLASEVAKLASVVRIRENLE